MTNRGRPQEKGQKIMRKGKRMPALLPGGRLDAPLQFGTKLQLEGGKAALVNKKDCSLLLYEPSRGTAYTKSANLGKKKMDKTGPTYGKLLYLNPTQKEGGGTLSSWE